MSCVDCGVVRGGSVEVGEVSRPNGQAQVRMANVEHSTSNVEGAAEIRRRRVGTTAEIRRMWAQRSITAQSMVENTFLLDEVCLRPSGAARIFASTPGVETPD